jgi:hypothetical protein
MTEPEPPQEALVFALSQEELYVALRYMKAPALIELEDFEARVFEGVPQPQRVAFIQVAERALLARQYLLPEPERKLYLHPSMAQVLGVCAQPRRSWFVLHRAREQAGGAYYFHEKEGLFVSHAIPLQGIHEFTVFPDSQPIQQLLVELIAPAAVKPCSYPPGVIAQETFQKLTGAEGPLDPQRVAQELVQAGVDAEAAGHFGRSLGQFDSVTVLTRLLHPDAGEPVPEAGMTVVVGAEALWFLEPDGAKDLSLRCVDPMALPGALEGIMLP